MTHYEQRLQADLERLQRTIRSAGEKVQEALDQSLQAILTGDKSLASILILRDQVINRDVFALNHLCHTFVARHLPSAGHLRYISSVIQMGIALERIGDYAVTICRETNQLSSPPPPTVRRDIELLGDEASRSYGEALQAFLEQNAERARGTRQMTSHVSSTYDKVFSDLMEEADRGAHPVRDLFSMLIVFNRLERVSDQAQNICEEAIFAATGEVKKPKKFRILFVDAENALAAPMAAAIARKAFTGLAEYAAAGREGDGGISEPVRDFLDAKGHEVRSLPLVSAPDLRDLVGKYHIVVDLSGKVSRETDIPPYHTVLLRWEIDSIDSLDFEGEEGRNRLETLYRDLVVRIRDLMEMLTGEGEA